MHAFMFTHTPHMLTTRSRALERKLDCRLTTQSFGIGESCNGWNALSVYTNALGLTMNQGLGRELHGG